MTPAPTITPDEHAALKRLAERERTEAQRGRRESLAKSVRITATFRRSEIRKRREAVLEDFDRELADSYNLSDEEISNRLAAAIEEVYGDAAKRLRARYRELGAKESYVPTFKLSSGYVIAGKRSSDMGAAVNHAAKGRRDELRERAEERIGKLVTAAAHKVDHWTARTQEEIELIEDPNSKEALALPKSCPTVEQLVPSVRLADVIAEDPPTEKGE